MIFTSITQRFVAWFLTISLLPILLIGYSLLHTFEKELRQTLSLQVSAIADKKADQIDAYLSERIHDAEANTQEDTTRRAMIEFTQAFARNGAESEAYRRLDASHRDYYRRFIASTGFYDLFLVSPQGDVVYSQNHESDFATNLFTGPFRNSGLAQVTRAALNSLESGISKYEFYAPSGNAAAAFVAAPIIIEGKVAGVLALQIDNAQVFKVLLDKTGLGNSGETLVARLEDERTALVMAPLINDPDATLKRKIPLGDQLPAKPLMHALNGERGSGFEIDYTGQPVVATWRYLPRMRWGMVVKIDTAEALAPYYRVRNFSLTALGLAIFLTFLGAVMLGRRVIAPLRNLNKGALDIAAGKFDQRFSVIGRDELGQLAASFNTMAEHLQSSYANLEDQVEQRTTDLSRALKQEQEAQWALLKERDFAASLVNTAPVIVLLLDTQGGIEYINPYFEQLAGYRLDEVKGKDWFRTFLPEHDQDAIRALFQKAAHDEPTRGNINPIVTRSGETLDIEWYDQAIRNAQGEVVSVLATGQDVTARRAMERTLSASTERLSEAQRIAQVGSWELDLLKGKLTWSDEIFNLFEIDKSRFGATYEAFLNAIHPDDRDTVNQAYTHSLETRAPYEITHRLLMSDGRIKWVHERCETVFDADGKPLRSMGTVQDITERMRSEMKYQTILKTTQDAFWICDLQGRFLDVNDAYCELIGYSREALLAMSIPDVEAMESAEDTRAHVEKVITVGADRFETVHRRQDGSLVNFEVSVNFMPEEGGRIVVFLRDITLRKLEEVALIEAKQAAEAANQAKSEFLANMSHEIRTPMNAILGLTQLVLDTELTPRQQDFLGKTHTSARALLGILNDILDYSKIEAGRMEVERVAFRLEGVLENVTNLFSARAEEKGLELFLEIAPDAPAEILGDPLRLTQVLNNLVGNALKFTERGEIHIKVEVAARNHATQKLRFSVRDTGIGLSKAQSDRLFQPFTQADGSITRKYGGTGLGLSICQRLVGLMDGEISVSGVEGQGSTFTFTIQAGIVPPHESTPDLQQMCGLRALVVDDQETSRQILQQLLEAWGLEVDTAASGEEALAQNEAGQLSGKPYDVLLLDWRMPGIDGLEVARRIEQDAAQDKRACPLRVVMVTAFDKERLQEAAGSIRLNGVLAKPVIPSYLFDILVNWRQPGAVTVAAGKGSATGATRPAARFLPGVRILLVEDNQINQQVAAEFLKLRGAKVTLANNGTEAVERVGSEVFDAVLMDLHMPVMDGFEAARRIRELPQCKSLPIIAMTAAVLQEDRDRCNAAGMVDFIAKPIDPEQMVEVLLKWVKTDEPKPADQTQRQSEQAPFSFASSPASGRGLRSGDGILPLSMPGFDLKMAVQRLEGNSELLARLLTGFAEEQSETLAQLDALMQAGEGEQVAILLHTLKGVAATLGAVALAEAAQQLEQEVKEGDELGAMPAFAEALNAALDAIRTHIAPAQSATGESVLNLDELAQVLNHLVPYLQEQELVPVDLMESLRGLARSNRSDKPLARLIRQVDHFDHDGALASVAQLAAIYGVTLGDEDFGAETSGQPT